MPSVVTGNELYTNLLDNKKDCLIAYSVTDWYQHLVALANNSALRNGIADNAREKCMSELNGEQAVKILLSFIH